MKKIFSRTLWTILSAVLTALVIAAIIGTNICHKYEPFINAFFEVELYRVENDGSDEDSTYFKSDYLGENGKYDDETMLGAAKQVSEIVATEGIVMLKNNNDALPLAHGDNVSLLGISSVNWLYSGYGSGHVDNANAKNFMMAMNAAGFNVNSALNTFYTNCGYRRTAGQGQISLSPMNNSCNECPWNKYPSSVKSSFEKYSTAIITLSRDGGEGAPWDPDLTNVINDGLPYSTTHNEIDARFRNNNYLQLTKEEKEMIEQVVALKQNGTFKKVVLLLNSSNTMQMDILSTFADIDAILAVGMGGTMATSAVANILSGKYSPSGRLTDTYVYDNWSAPAMENFVPKDFVNISDYPEITRLESGAEDDDSYIVRQEGIYVGYRYYETRYEDCVLSQGNAKGVKGVYAGKNNWNYSDEVCYPFGYGLSYTTFDYLKTEITEKNGDYIINVEVKNTGGVSGKEVVQVYLQKPYTQYDKDNKIEKSAIELVGFEKTEEIEPNGTAKVSITVPKKAFRTYDSYNAKTYILEKGDYYLSIGKNAHDALNNVLSLKGKSKSDGMDYDGDNKFAKHIKINADDKKAFSVSETTGNKITNAFDNADINLYDGRDGQTITYLSRSDWEATYPTERYSLKITNFMANEIKYVAGGEVEENENDEMPVTGMVTADEEYLSLLDFAEDEIPHLKLIHLMDKKFDDPLWENLLDQLTFKEMASIIIKGGMGTPAVASIAMPGTVTRDGPAGLGRLFADAFGKTRAGVNYPSPCLMASSFNRELVKDLGRLFGTELMHYGINGIYAPGAGIHRAAYSGRSWEYYSEDGYLSGEMLSAECSGLTSVGCITYAKHIGFNDQEGDRNGVTVWSNEQSFREIYLAAYEKSCTENTTNALMSAYNRIGGLWAGIHKGLLTDIVRGEWGFKGHVITDAYSYNYMATFAEGVVAGNDLWLGATEVSAFNRFANNATVVKAMRNSCHSILYTILHSNAMNGVTKGARIVEVTPWWKNLLMAIDITLGVLAAGCVAMATVSYVIYFKNKKSTAVSAENN